MDADLSDLSIKSVLIGEFPRFISKKEFYLRCFMLFAKLGTILLFAKQIYMLLNIFFLFKIWYFTQQSQIVVNNRKKNKQVFCFYRCNLIIYLRALFLQQNIVKDTYIYIIFLTCP